jgi:hypothetical protein
MEALDPDEQFLWSVGALPLAGNVFVGWLHTAFARHGCVADFSSDIG